MVYQMLYIWDATQITLNDRFSRFNILNDAKVKALMMRNQYAPTAESDEAMDVQEGNNEEWPELQRRQKMWDARNRMVKRVAAQRRAARLAAAGGEGFEAAEGAEGFEAAEGAEGFEATEGFEAAENSGMAATNSEGTLPQRRLSIEVRREVGQNRANANAGQGYRRPWVQRNYNWQQRGRYWGWQGKQRWQAAIWQWMFCPWMPRPWMPRPWVPRQLMQRQWVPRQWMQRQWVPRQWMQRQWIPRQGMPRQGMPRQWMSRQVSRNGVQKRQPQGKQSAQGNQRRPMPSKQKLDSELDEYMSKSRVVLDRQLDEYMASANDDAAVSTEP